MHAVSTDAVYVASELSSAWAISNEVHTDQVVSNLGVCEQVM